MINTRHLTYDEGTGHVTIDHEAGDIDLGPLDAFDDEVPSAIYHEIKELRGLIKEALDYGRACDATARAADEARHDSRGW